ncbi:MAG: RNase adaptor protein RapZ, partial [Candidatus Eremiobacteraeota bacterium]|nr:RNase adaptor protein RapZ [Candidatus Eremiobacteraeota bacterium]
DEAVGAFIEMDPAFAPFMDKMYDMIDFLLPRYIAEGKSQLTIGIGCTGGRHRSVYIARRLFDHLRTNEQAGLHIVMRDTAR